MHTTSNTLNDDSELRKIVEDSVRHARANLGFTLNNHAAGEENISMNVETIMAAIHQHDEARTARIKDPTLQDVIDAGVFPTPEEYEKMIWMLNWYREQLTNPEKGTSNE